MVGSQLVSTSVALPRYRPSSTMIGLEIFRAVGAEAMREGIYEIAEVENWVKAEW